MGPSRRECQSGSHVSTLVELLLLPAVQYQTNPKPPAVGSDSTTTLQGCYADADGGDRRMTPLWSDDRMTPTLCGLLAKHEGYTVAGLKYHRECWCVMLRSQDRPGCLSCCTCGQTASAPDRYRAVLLPPLFCVPCRASNDLTYVTALGTSTGCTATCAGDAASKCGGSRALSVYSLPGFTAIGCFRDSWNRMLPDLLHTNGLMNPARCAGLAKDNGYTVFGIQNSVECRAGTDVARAKSLGASTACTMACHNAPTGECGGNLANAVYVVGSNRPPAAAAPNKGFTVVGCYRDNIADRGLTNLLASDVSMTVDKCAAMAKKAGAGAVHWQVVRHRRCERAAHNSRAVCVLRGNLCVKVYSLHACSHKQSVVCLTSCRVHGLWSAVGPELLCR